MSQNNFDILPQSTVEASHQCWSCGDMRAALFCDSCGRLQPAAPTDYFTFFGLPRQLNLDLAQLEREYYRLSRRLHPDLYASATPQEKEWSLQKTSQLNDAYRTLREPVARTEYLLKLEGLYREEASADGAKQKPAAPPELLAEVFELNMQLEELRMNRTAGGQDADLERDLAEQEAGFSAKLDAVDHELRGLWTAWDFAAASPAADAAEARKRAADAMLALLNRRNYLRNLVRDVREALAG